MPIVCAKNLGARSGVGSHFSYGPKDDDSGVIGSILGGGKAMHYSRSGADVEFYFFDGEAEISISTKSNDTFNNKLESAGNEMFSLFTSFIPYGNVIGSAKNIFALIDSASEPALTSAGEALIRTHYSRLDIDGSGEKGKIIHNPLRESAGDWDVGYDKNVTVGQYFAIYTDLSTRFQQRSQGYYDFWQLNGPPDLSAKIELKPDNTLQAYYRIERD
jgi:hypothetical protein